MDFGLGLVLSLTDNASAGLNNAVNSLDRLTQTAASASSSLTGLAQIGAVSAIADQVGSSFIGMGGRVLGSLGGMLGKVQKVGGEFEGFRITLNALYGDAEKAEKQIGKLLDFSIKSPFNVDEVKDMLVVMKSQGIDAFKKMSNESKTFKQENLAWIADLMAFKPDIDTRRWKLAIQNFVGSGMPKVLENALDMGKIEEILGHKMGKTVGERMDNIREIVTKKGLEGLADKMSNSWTGVASNVEDAWIKLYKAVSDNGVFDTLKGAFMGMSGAILNLKNKDLESLGKTIAEGFNFILTPITKVAEAVNGLINTFIKLSKTHPGLVKLAITIIALSGSFLMISGVSLKLFSALGYATIAITQFGNAFRIVSATLKSGALRILGSLLPLTITLGLIYLTWKNDLGGIRTLLTNFVGNIQSAFNEARRAAKMNVEGLMNVVASFESKGTFWDNFTIGLIKLKVLWMSLCDAWNDYELSEDLYQKAKELGLLPLIEAILTLKWNWSNFCEGFKKGVSETLNSLKKLAKGFSKSFDGTFIEKLIDKATEFFQLLSTNDPKGWKDFGEMVGGWVVKFIALKTAFNVFGKIKSLVLIILSVFDKFGWVIVRLYLKFTEFRTNAVQSFNRIKSVAVSAFGKIKQVIAPVVTWLKNHLGRAITTVKGKFLSIANTIKTKFLPIITKIWDKLLPVRKAFSKIAQVIGDKLSPVLRPLKTLFKPLINLFTKIGPVASIAGAAIALVAIYATTHWEEFKTKVLKVWNTVKKQATKVWDKVKEVFGSVWDNLKESIASVKENFEAFKTKFTETADTVTQSTAFQTIVEILSKIGSIIVDILVPAFQIGATIISTVFQLILSIVGFVFNSIIDVIRNAINLVMGVISGGMDIIKGIFTLDLDSILEGFKEIFGSIWEFLDKTFGDLIENALTWGIDFIQGLIDGIGSMVSAVGDAVSNVADTITSFLHFSVPDRGPLTQYETWMPDFMQGLADGINSSTRVVEQSLQGFTGRIQKGLNNGALEAFALFVKQWIRMSKMVYDSTELMAKGVVKSGSYMAKSLTTLMKTAVGAVKDAVKVMKDTMKFQWKLPDLKVPHVKVSGSFDIEKAKAPEFKVDWYAKGGVFTQPSLIGVGESGKEAVMPLENNTGWIQELAYMLTSQMSQVAKFKPVTTSSTVTNNTSNAGSSYMTSSVDNSRTQHSTDNSVTFASGAIQINCQNASEAEAKRMAEYIMKYITRQKQLNKMLSYG